MVTTSKVQFREQSKGVVAETSVESDDMSPEEVEKKNEELFDIATKYSRLKSMDKER